jgi:peptidoglycan-N-acetylglucosamine deacetylase
MKLLSAFLVSCLILCTPVSAQTFAVTLDDGPHLNQTPLMSPQERNQAMLGALEKHKIKAALFVTVENGAARPAGLALARAWGEAGHFIGNHTMTHLDLNKAEVSLEKYQQEIMACDAVIRELPGYRKWFRFTYLREGNTPEKRDGMRAFLKEKGYRNAYVTLDTSDWRFDGKLREVLARDPKADLAPIKRLYLEHLWQRAQAYRELSWKLQGRDIPQMLLIHHNLANALWLDDALAMFKEKGWRAVDPEEAYKDPIYALQPDRPVAGQSLLLSMSRSLGLGKFEGWERLFDDGEFEMQALNKLGY